MTSFMGFICFALFTILFRVANGFLAPGLCEPCLREPQRCQIFLRQLEAGAFGGLDPCKATNSSASEDVHLVTLEDGYYTCPGNELSFCILSLDAPFELRLRNSTLSAGMRTLLHLYVGELRDATQYALWYKWLFDMQRAYPGISSIGEEISMLTGAGGLPPTSLLMLLPPSRAGSPTAVLPLQSSSSSSSSVAVNFYTARGDKLTIKWGFCGDFSIEGRSQVENRTFPVTINDCGCAFMRDEHIRSVNGVHDYCDFFRRVEFTLKLYEGNTTSSSFSKTECAIESRVDLACIRLQSGRLQIACLRDRDGISEDVHRNLSHIVLRIKNSKCLLRHVFKLPTFEYASLQLRLTPKQLDYNPQNDSIVVRICLGVYCHPGPLRCEVQATDGNRLFAWDVIKPTDKPLTLSRLYCLTTVVVACGLKNDSSNLGMPYKRSIGLRPVLQLATQSQRISLVYPKTNFSVFGDRAKNVAFQSDELSCSMKPYYLPMNSHGIINASKATEPEYQITCYLKGCQWHIILDTRHVHEKKFKLTEDDRNPRCGFRCSMMLTMVVCFIIYITGFVLLLVMIVFGYARSDRRNNDVRSRRRGSSKSRELPPALPENAEAMVTVGPDILSPDAADSFEEILLAFRDILLISEELEKLKSGQTNY